MIIEVEHNQAASCCCSKIFCTPIRGVNNGRKTTKMVAHNNASFHNVVLTGAFHSHSPPPPSPAGADQNKYGKNRVEADAKRLQAKDDELARRKQEIRNRLTQLKKERRDLRSAVEATAG